MSRLTALCVIALWVGTTLALSELPWLRRLPLTERLQPFLPGGLRSRVGGSLFANRSFRDVLSPLATAIGARLSRGFGTGEEVALRLERVGSGLEVAEFRSRQVGRATAALGAVVGLLFLVDPSLPVAALLAVAVPLLVFLVEEQRLTAASNRHQQRVFAELPIVAEQLGMLLSSGFSLTGAIDRVARRGHGAVAADLARVIGRVGQGVAPELALREWARVAAVPEVHQLVSVLVLHQSTGDLGRLISQEARTMRRESQRRLIERIERRNEQVWIPVTVATLVPGVVFLTIPFVDALGSFGVL